MHSDVVENKLNKSSEDLRRYLTTFVIHSLKNFKLRPFSMEKFLVVSETEDKDFLINPFAVGVQN